MSVVLINSPAMFAQDLQVLASVDRTIVGLNEQVVLTIQVTGDFDNLQQPCAIFGIQRYKPESVYHQWQAHIDSLIFISLSDEKTGYYRYPLCFGEI